MLAAVLYAISWILATFFILIHTLNFSSFLGGIYTVLFIILGYAECFSMLSRGFSLQILVDVYTYRFRSQDQLMNEYSGKGVEFLLQKRIETLKTLRFLEEHANVLVLTKRGLIVGKAGLIIKNVLRLGKGG